MTDREFRKRWLRAAEILGEWEYLCVAFDHGRAPYPDLGRKMARFANVSTDEVFGLSNAWFPVNEEHQELRILFACLFSNMTVKEFEEVCGE